MDRKDVEVMTCCCKGNEDGNVKHKQRDEQEKKALMTRLSRIEGQVRGIRAMVEETYQNLCFGGHPRRK